MLSWGEKDNKDLQFPEHYWNYIINHYNQFAEGKHSVTKAFEHYLSFVDDYDFCWGPHNEGELLSASDYDYTERLWGVYTKTAGEIILLKAYEDFSGWEREEQLVFAPSGSRKANIIFDRNGHYRIIIEIVPAGGNEEIWVMEYPYTDNYIRKLFDGSNPVIVRDMFGVLHIFYQPFDDKTKICYRSSDDDYITEKILLETLSEREVDPLFCVYATQKNGVKNLLFFYYRSDDVQPIKYIMSNPGVSSPEVISPELEVEIELIDYTFRVEFTVVNMFTGKPVVGAEVSFADNLIITDEEGKAVFEKAGGDYTEVIVTHPDYEDFSVSVDITEDTEIILELLGDIVLDEEMTAEVGIASIEWEDTRKTVTLEVTDGSSPMQGIVVNFNNEEKTTNSEGKVVFTGIIAGIYDFVIDEEGYFYTTGSIEVENDVIVEIILEPEQDTTMIEEMTASVGLSSIEWEDMRRVVTFEIVDGEYSPLEGIAVQFDSSTITTDSTGKAIFNTIAGTYDFVIDEEGYFYTTGSISFEEDTTVQIMLEPEQNTNITEEMTASVDMEILWLEVEEE